MTVPVFPFGFIAGITQEFDDILMSQRFVQSLFGFDRIGLGAAIIELEKFFDHETGHQLRLRELVGTLGLGMVQKTVTCCP